METRSIAIGLVAIVAAFAAAFGVAKSGGSKTQTAGAGVKAAPINVAAPAVPNVAVGGTIPALKAQHKKAAKKTATSSPSTSSAAPSTQKSAPSTTQSAPSTPTTPKASAPVAPQQSAPKKSAPSGGGGGGGGGGVVGGGTDG